jgi:hypothetical protein
MKTIIRTIFAMFLLFSLTSFHCLDDNGTVLVLVNPVNDECFSKFEVEDDNGVLFGNNLDNYEVVNGIYRIVGSSKDGYRNRNIVIKSHEK